MVTEPAARAFDKSSEEQGMGLALVGLTGETKPDRVDAAYDCREQHVLRNKGIGVAGTAPSEPCSCRIR